MEAAGRFLNYNNMEAAISSEMLASNYGVKSQKSAICTNVIRAVTSRFYVTSLRLMMHAHIGYRCHVNVKISEI
jgi:hypothetical protein